MRGVFAEKFQKAGLLGRFEAFLNPETLPSVFPTESFRGTRDVNIMRRKCTAAKARKSERLRSPLVPTSRTQRQEGDGTFNQRLLS